MIIVPNNFILVDDLDAGITTDHPIVGYHNLVTIGSLAASSEDPLFPARNLANSMTFPRWKSLVSTAQTLTITTGYVPEIDYVAFAGHNFGSQGVQVQIEGDAVELVPANLPADDAPLLYRFQKTSVASLVVNLLSNGDPPEVAVMYAGTLLALKRKIYVPHRPITMSRTFNTVNPTSNAGNFLGEVTLGATSSTSFAMQNLPPDWVRSLMWPWLESRKPFFFGWRPASYPAEIGYCWLMNSPTPANQRNANGFMQVEVQMGGIV